MALNARDDKYTAMTTQPIQSLVLRLAAPTIACMMISSIYNMEDTIFVGRLSTEAVAAVGVSYPFMTFIQAFGYFFAQGSGNYISKAMGARKTEEAEKMAIFGFIAAVLLGCLFALLSGIFLKQLAVLLGAYPDIMVETLQYLRWITLGTPFMMGTIVLNLQFRFQGNANRSMIGIGVGAVVNLVLDPLLIFTFRLKITGAALATLIGQACGFAILLFQMQRWGTIKLQISKCKITKKMIKELCRGGTPSFFRQGLGSVSGTCLNLMAKNYGTVAVAAFAAVSKVMNLATSLINGFGQGFQPVCGYNYGAKQYRRVRNAYLFCLKVECIACLAISILGLTAAPWILSLIRDEDAQVMQIGAYVLRLQCVTFPMICLISMTNMTTQVLGKVFFATFEAMARQGIFFIPAVLLLPKWLGLTGVALAQPVSDLCAFIISIFILRRVWRELKSEEDNVEISRRVEFPE